MLQCIFLKRKLYDYVDNSLSEIDRIKVEKHLERCPHCQQRLNQIKAILECAGSKNIPSPNNEFWHNFKAGLDRRLNEALAGPVTFTQKPKFYLRPAFASAAIGVFFLAIGISLYKFPRPNHMQLAQDDRQLVEEAATIEELTETSELNHDEDAYLEEIDLLMQLEQA